MFIAIISIHIRRIEGANPLLAYTQLSAGTLGVLVFNIPAVLFLVASFRPDRSPELTYLINDLGWMLLVIDWPPFVVQNIAVAVAILGDKSPQPIFPRWLGFFELWSALLYTGPTLLPFFKTGPFAWNGLFSFWVPAAAFGVWSVVMLVAILRAIKSQEREAAS